MAKAAKLVAVRGKRKILLVWHSKRHMWMLPGGKRKRGESAKQTLLRELSEELSGAKVKRLRLYRRINKQRDTIYRAKVTGRLKPGREVTKVTYSAPWRLKCTPTTKLVCMALVKDGYLKW